MIKTLSGHNKGPANAPPISGPSPSVCLLHGHIAPRAIAVLHGRSAVTERGGSTSSFSMNTTLSSINTRISGRTQRTISSTTACPIIWSSTSTSPISASIARPTDRRALGAPTWASNGISISHHRAPVTLGASFYVEFPTGNEKQQLGSGLIDYWLNLCVQEPLSEKTRVNVNLGYLFAGNTTGGRHLKIRFYRFLFHLHAIFRWRRTLRWLRQQQRPGQKTIAGHARSAIRHPPRRYLRPGVVRRPLHSQPKNRRPDRLLHRVPRYLETPAGQSRCRLVEAERTKSR